jgi:SsrA-binding protein
MHLSYPVVGKTLKYNKHAGFKFNIEEKIEAGVLLKGLDVKDFKQNRFEIRDSLVRVENGEAFVYNIHLESTPEESNKRKLLLNRREISNLQKTLQNKRMHAFIIQAYTNPRGIVKLEVGIGTIKKNFEHKTAEKRSSEKRQVEKYIKDNI